MLSHGSAALPCSTHAPVCGMSSTHVTLAARCVAQAQPDPHAVRRGRRPERKLTRRASDGTPSSRRHAASRRLCPSHTPEQRPVPIARRRRLRLSLLSFFPTGLFWGVVGRSQRVEVVLAERDGLRCCVSLWDGTGMSVVLVGRRLLCRSPCDLL